MSERDYDDEAFYAQEAAREEMIDNAIREISEDSIRAYLGCNGDAIDERVQKCLQEARALLSLQYFGSSLISATSAIELIIRFFLIRPLLQGAFLSDEWSYLLSQRIATGRSVEDREILPNIVKMRGIDIDAIELGDGKPLWGSVRQRVYPKRDRVIHAAESATQEDAELSIECAGLLYSSVALPIAKELGFTLETTGRWAAISGSKGSQTWSAYFVRMDPFAPKKTK